MNWISKANYFFRLLKGMSLLFTCCYSHWDNLFLLRKENKQNTVLGLWTWARGMQTDVFITVRNKEHLSRDIKAFHVHKILKVWETENFFCSSPQSGCSCTQPHEGSRWQVECCFTIVGHGVEAFESPIFPALRAASFYWLYKSAWSQPPPPHLLAWSLRRGRMNRLGRNYASVIKLAEGSQVWSLKPSVN